MINCKGLSEYVFVVAAANVYIGVCYSILFSLFFTFLHLSLFLIFSPPSPHFCPLPQSTNSREFNPFSFFLYYPFLLTLVMVHRCHSWDLGPGQKWFISPPKPVFLSDPLFLFFWSFLPNLSLFCCHATFPSHPFLSNQIHLNATRFSIACLWLIAMKDP